MIRHATPKLARRALAAAAAFLALLSGAAVADDDCTGACAEALGHLRHHTAQYHDEGQALADGYVADPACVALPGVGGMGHHYVDPAWLTDPGVNSNRPEVLLYEPEPNGRRRLVAVEYLVPVLSNGTPWSGSALQPPPVVDNPPPVLFGQTFLGPMPGHVPGMPWHYELHVWVWKNNPSGIFASWNPRVNCQ